MKQQKAPCNALEAAGAGERDVQGSYSAASARQKANADAGSATATPAAR